MLNEDCWESLTVEDTTNHTGTGGGLRYITEEATANMFSQERSHSCHAACVRQLLSDAGVDLSEDTILEKTGYLEGWGISAEATARALDELHPQLGYAGGAVDPDAAALLFARDPWIASLKTDFGTVHAVIVDRLDGDIVHVRDPWGLFGPGSGSGTQATLQLSDFLEHWQWAIHNAVFPCRQK